MTHAKRLTPQQIAERFGALKREHDAKEKRRKLARERSAFRQDAAVFLESQDTPVISSGLGEGLKSLGRLRGPSGRFIGVKTR